MIYAFMAGVILRLSPALDIIHELMHYGFCNAEGIRVLELHWSRILYEHGSAIVMYGGYWGEFLLYSAIVLFTYKHVKISAFFFGVLTVSLLTSYFSLDFNEHARAYFMDSEAVVIMKVIWAMFTTPIYLILVRQKVIQK